MPGRTRSDDLGPIDDVLDAATVLFELDAARAEAWASGLLAEVPDEVALLDALRAAGDATALAIAVALTPMVPAAADLATELESSGLTPPAYAPHVGTAAPVDAWVIHDPHGDGTSLVVEYEHADGLRHDLLVELESGVAVDVLFSPPGVVEIAQSESDRQLRIDASSPELVHARIRDALTATADRPDAPITDAFLLNHALLAARVGSAALPVPASDPDRSPRPWRAPDPDGDAAALATLTSTLGESAAAAPADVPVAASALRAACDAGDADAVAVVEEAGVHALDEIPDGELLVRVAGAYVRPGPRAGLAPAAADAIDALEWADWLGAVLQLVRGGPGSDASPEQLVRNINRCPEITTSIPKRDAPAVASAFACAMPAWRATGAVDGDDRLTGLGAWLLPKALAAAWAPEGDPA